MWRRPGQRRLAYSTRSIVALRFISHCPLARRVRFTFAPASFEVAGQTFYRPAWQADNGVAYTLESTNAVLSKAGNSYYDLTTGQPYNPGNPFFSGPSYTLGAPIIRSTSSTGMEISPARSRARASFI